MFNYCLILNAHPFYVLAQDEKDLEGIIKVYGNKALTVIKAPSLEVMEFKLQMNLSSKNTLLIPSVVNETAESFNKLISTSEQEEMIEDLVNDIN